ncbi:sulfotransferase [Aliivibrio logei]|uniref:sulfotransferase n=1 Tax=Aliivibrio logei TaxID=688 RepID=UPI0035C91544
MMNKLVIKSKLIIRRLLNEVLGLAYMKEYEKYGKEKLNHQPIFIIGAPRTGSTILYQALTNYYDVSYIDNCVDKWHRNLFYGFKKSHKNFGNKPHNVFKAEFGSTSKFSEHAPSECGGFWYRWLPKDRHFVDANEISQKSKEQLYAEVCAVTNYFDKPLMFKNLNVGQRLRFIKEVFPDARFIYIKRSHENVIESILKGRKKLGIKKNKWWGIKPRSYLDLLHLDEYEMVSEGIKKIEEQIEKDLNLFDIKITLHYDNLSDRGMFDLGELFNLNQRDGKPSLPKFRKDKGC